MKSHLYEGKSYNLFMWKFPSLFTILNIKQTLKIIFVVHPRNISRILFMTDAMF